MQKERFESGHSVPAAQQLATALEAPSRELCGNPAPCPRCTTTLCGLGLALYGHAPASTLELGFSSLQPAMQCQSPGQPDPRGALPGLA